MKFEWLTRWFQITIEIFSSGMKVRRYEVMPRRRLESVRRDLLKRTCERLGFDPQEGTS